MPQIFIITRADSVRALPVRRDYVEAARSVDRMILETLLDELGELSRRPIVMEYTCNMSSDIYAEREWLQAACSAAEKNNYWEVNLKYVNSRRDLSTLEIELSYCLDAPDKFPAGSVVFLEDARLDYVIRPSVLSR